MPSQLLRQLSNNSNQIAKLTLEFKILIGVMSQTLSILPQVKLYVNQASKTKLDGDPVLKKTGLLRDAVEIEHPAK
jgi:hypothetical protein